MSKCWSDMTTEERIKYRLKSLTYFYNKQLTGYYITAIQSLNNLYRGSRK